MKHLTEEQLILHYYGEPEERLDAAEHLGVCKVCRSRFEALKQELSLMNAATVPERGEDYSRWVWQRLGPKLAKAPASQPFRLIHFPRSVMAAAMALLVAGAFLMGRFWPRQETRSMEPVPVAARDRILRVKVADHLERSQVALLELVHSEDGNSTDLSADQELAGDLIAANRLYRQTALIAGETGLAAVLDELERILLEVANTEPSKSDLEEIRHRIEEQGILFKVRVLSSEVRSREKGVLREAAGESL
jgi:hypothetical protein